LLAEDNPADVTLVCEALKEHRVDCVLSLAKDGAEAINLIEKLDRDLKEPDLDLVLLDMHLPKSDGQHILKRLRSTERLAQTPVIVLTASVSPHDEATAEKQAVRHYFRKPTTLDRFMELGAIVRDLLAANRAWHRAGRRAGATPPV
jgi:CheY-like chemotaxis protein